MQPRPPTSTRPDTLFPSTTLFRARREKATSNICTAQVLLAVMAAMYAVYHGPDGLVRIARRTHRLAAILAAALRKRGVEVGGDFFATPHVPGVDAAAIPATTAAAGINLRRIDDYSVGLSLEETHTRPERVSAVTLIEAPVHATDAARARPPAPPSP